MSGELSQIIARGYARTDETNSIISTLTEQFPAMDQVLHYGTAVKTLIYDTTQDTDGGMWRNRCQHTTWYNEALGGTSWIQAPTSQIDTADGILQAWKNSGFTPNTIYQSSPNKLHYVLSSATVRTKVNRGISKGFPAKAAIVLEADKLTIYDLTADNCPMWMVFLTNTNGHLRSSNCTSATISNGLLVVGSSDNGVFVIDFVADRSIWIYNTGTANTGVMPLGIGSRNTSQLRLTPQPYNISGFAVTDVSMVYLPTSPLNPRTGLPMPTIAVALGTNVSIIDDTQTVRTVTNATAMGKVALTKSGKLYIRNDAASGVCVGLLPTAASTALASWRTGNFDTTTYPALLGNPDNLNDYSIYASSLGFTVVKENPSVPTKSMTARVTNTYNTGWMVGDTRGCYLSDTSTVMDASTRFITGNLLTAGDAAASDSYGRSVALSGNGTVMVIGASTWEGAATNQGGVYVYDLTAGAWVQRGGVVTTGSAGVADYFGTAVALSNDASILVVGAPFREGGSTDQGAVYTFDWSGSAWVQRSSILLADDGATSDYFGYSLALSNDGLVLVVGSIQWEGGLTDQGAVYTYDWSGSAWVQRGSVLTAGDAASGDSFGSSVTLNSVATVLVVGAYRRARPYATQGGVYTYDLVGGAWVQRGGILTASDAAVNDQFGIGVSLTDDGTVLAVGAYRWEGRVTDQGGVYLYDLSGSTWSQRGSVISAADSADTDFFGISVALNSNGSILAVGASSWEGSAADQGAVYVCQDVASLASITGVVWDRSQVQTNANIYGNLTKTPVATGSSLVWYSGFSPTSYISRPVSSNLDFGTGDFCCYGWTIGTPVNDVSSLVTRALTGQTDAASFGIKMQTSTFRIYAVVGGAFYVASSNASIGNLNFFAVYRRGGRILIKVNQNAEVDTGANATDLSGPGYVTRVGLGGNAWDSSCEGVSLALLRFSATAPSAEQLTQIYNDELPLFQAGAKCVIDGDSPAVKDSNYDPDTNTYDINTSYGRSSFQGLLRVSSPFTLKLDNSTKLITTATGVTSNAPVTNVYVPELTIRDRISTRMKERQSIDRDQQTLVLDPISFTSPTTSGSPNLTGSSVVGTPYVGMGVYGTGIPAGATLISVSGTSYVMSANATTTNAGAVAITQNTFTATKGYAVKSVFLSGYLKRPGTTKDYVITNDGYQDTVVFGIAIASSSWVVLAIAKTA